MVLFFYGVGQYVMVLFADAGARTLLTVSLCSYTARVVSWGWCWCCTSSTAKLADADPDGHLRDNDRGRRGLAGRRGICLFSVDESGPTTPSTWPPGEGVWSRDRRHNHC